MGAIEKKVDIIFTGLIRNPELIEKSITDFASLRKKGLVNRIIFSDKADRNDLFTRRLLDSINQFNTSSNFLE